MTTHLGLNQIRSLNLIGAGSYSDVYEDGDIVYRVLKDYRSLKQTLVLYASYCDHPNLMRPFRTYKLYDHRVYDHRIVEVLPRAMGDLTQLNRLILMYDTKKIYLDVAFALEHMHSLGVTHNDITEKNILLFEDKAVLADYDLLAITELGVDYLYGDKFIPVEHSHGTPPEFKNLYVTYSDGYKIPVMSPLNSFAPDMWRLGMVILRVESCVGSCVGHKFANIHLKTQDEIDDIISREMCGSMFVNIVKSLLRCNPSERMTITELIGAIKSI